MIISMQYMFLEFQKFRLILVLWGVPLTYLKYHDIKQFFRKLLKNVVNLCITSIVRPVERMRRPI
ncbi:hypothetical protein CJI50_06860 [Bifidobacteriaceae bacterium NR021]|nr:hypothetical protein CJI50_06860 [Bifidobacteriaceae bacterium NR021]